MAMLLYAGNHTESKRKRRQEIPNSCRGICTLWRCYVIKWISIYYNDARCKEFALFVKKIFEKKNRSFPSGKHRQKSCIRWTAGKCGDALCGAGTEDKPLYPPNRPEKAIHSRATRWGNARQSQWCRDILREFAVRCGRFRRWSWQRGHRPLRSRRCSDHS